MQEAHLAGALLTLIGRADMSENGRKYLSLHLEENCLSLNIFYFIAGT